MHSTPLSASFTPTAAPAVVMIPSSSDQHVPAARPISVLHLINGEHFAGAERVQQILGQRLPQFQVYPTFACLKPGKFPEVSGLPESQIRLVPMKGRFDLGVVRALCMMIRDEHHKLIHAHTPRAALIASVVSRWTKTPWVYHVHSPTARDSTRVSLNRINDLVERASLLQCSKLITVSKSLRREMLSRGWKRSQVVAINNGVRVQEPIDPQSRCHASTWRLGMVALFRPRKGLEVLLEALSMLPPDLDVVVDIVGGFESPEYEKRIHGRIEELGVGSRIRFLGFTKDVIGATRQMDAMVLPSLFGEGMPMVVLEALSCGVPVIATRVEGTPEVIREGREGVLAEPRDPHSLAKAIERLTSDRKAWQAMSLQAVQRHRERFTDEHMSRSVAKAYRSMLD